MSDMDINKLYDKLEDLEKLFHKVDVKLARLEERQSSQAKFWGFLGGMLPASVATALIFIKGK